MVGLLTVDLHIPHARSLKEKRVVMRSLKDKIRSRFNVSVAELEGAELWQRAVLGVALVSNDGAHISQTLNRVVELIRSERRAMVVDYRVRFLA